jgi:ABC-type nitrate/sulfonate/bicarbonate transport system permease component
LIPSAEFRLSGTDRRRWLRPATDRGVHLLWPIGLILLVWYAWVEFDGVPPAVAPSPGSVLSYSAGHLGPFARYALDTMGVTIAGLAIGTVAGALLASLSWFSPAAEGAIAGPAIITQCIPVLTMIPVLARVFGYGTLTVIVIAALIGFFPVLVFATTGLRQTPPGSNDVFVAFGASRLRRFRYLAAPSSVPHLLVALRLSVVAAIVGTLLAQWIMGSSGLGYILATAEAESRTQEAWAASLVSIVLSVILYGLTSAAANAARDRFE